MKKINFEEYRSRVNKKEVKKSLAELVNNLETILFRGKEWVVVVLIPMIELLISILALIDNHNRDDFNDDYWR